MENEEQVQEDIQQNQEIDTPKEQVITDEMVQLFGVPNSMVGKPIGELAKSYKSASKKLTQLAQENSQLKSTVSKVKAPDPLEYSNDGDYDKAMKDYLQATVAEYLSPIQSQLLQQQTQNVFTAIQKELPDENPEAIAQEWMEENGYTPEDGQRVFQGDVNRVIKSIVNYRKAKQLDEVRRNISKESNDKAIEAIKKSLKFQPKESDLNSVSKKAIPTEDSIESRIAQKLENEQQFLE